MTEHKKKILDLYSPLYADFTAKKIGAPPFDIYSISYILHGPDDYKKPLKRESTRRTLELMVKQGFLIKTRLIERRNGITCTVSRYDIAFQ